MQIRAITLPTLIATLYEHRSYFDATAIIDGASAESNYHWVMEITKP